jgi:hypothetical protein
MSELPNEPISDFVRQLGETHGEQYQHRLFAELALHLANVKLPENPTQAGRKQGVLKALHRMIADPALLEPPAAAPASAHSSDPIMPQRTRRSRPAWRDPQDAKTIGNLQKRVARVGFLDIDMIPKNRVLQLHYAPVPRKSGSLPSTPAHPLSMILTPTIAYWTVKQYDDWSERSGYIEYLQNRTITKRLFNVIGVDSVAGAPEEVENLIGEAVSIGRVSVGNEFSLDYDFSAAEKEVADHAQDVSFQTLRLDATLHQAYLGYTLDYPIFGSR